MFNFLYYLLDPQAKNVHLVAVGVGDYENYEEHLAQIAGSNVHTVDNFDHLSDLFKTIIAETCSKLICAEFLGYDNDLI